MKKTYQGSCHCGSVRFEADIDLAAAGTGKCNCTYCTKVRSWTTFVKPAAFRLQAGRQKLRAYHRHEGAPLKHHCAECGVHTHATGDADYMGGPFVGVFLAALDDVEPKELIEAAVRYSDGLNDNWQNPPAEARHL